MKGNDYPGPSSQALEQQLEDEYAAHLHRFPYEPMESR